MATRNKINIRPPTQFGVGFKRFFKLNSSPESSVQIIKRPYFIALKVLFVIAAIAFIVIGLLMIDDSCGCVRSQDKLMMLMLKVHVGLGILMLVVSLGMSQLYPRFGILFILLILLAILGIDGWIFNNYKRCVGNTDLVQSDKRFLTWLVTTMIISGALSLTTLIIIGFLINRYGKGEVIKKSASNMKGVNDEYRKLAEILETKLTEKMAAYQRFASENGVINQIETIDKNALFLRIPPDRIINALERKKTGAQNNVELVRGFETEIKKFNSLKESYEYYLNKKKALNEAEILKVKECDSTFGIYNEAKCTAAIAALKDKISEIDKELKNRPHKIIE